MKTKHLNFPSEHGHELAASLDLPPDEEPFAYALFAHCFTCNRNYKAIKNISRELTLRGIGVFRFDFTGLGESEGDFGALEFASNLSDLRAAAAHMEQEYAAPSLLLGHSLGGAAVLLGAKDISSAKAVITIGAPADTAHVTRHLKGDLEEVLEKGEGEVTIAGRPFTVSREFLDSLDETNMEEHVRNLDRPLMIMHAPADNVVSIDNAAILYNYAMHPKNFVSLDRADHMLTKESDSGYVAGMISTWCRRYLHYEEPEPLRTDKRVAVRIGASGYATEVKAGHHGFVVDEPISLGGTDLGPTPYDLLSASLGSCTAITLRMYADRKEWPLEEVTVHLQHDKAHATECRDCEDKGAKLDHLTRYIELAGPLTEQQRQRLLEIANKCPVHRTLTSDIVINTELINTKNDQDG